MIARVATLVRFELEKLWGRRVVLVPVKHLSGRGAAARALLAPPLLGIVCLGLAAVALLSGYGDFLLDRAREIAGQASDEAPFKNAWSAAAGAARVASRLGLIALVMLASMSLSEEAQYGTLKSILTRPYKRRELVLAKAIALSLLVLALVSLLAAAGFSTGAALYDFGDVCDHDYKEYVVLTSAEMGLAAVKAFAGLLPPMLALIGFSLLISSLIEQPGYAVGVAMGGLLSLQLLGSLSAGIAPFLFTSYLGFLVDSTLDAAPLGILYDMAMGYSTVSFKVETMARSALVCGVTGLGCLWLATWRLSRRDIGD
jgi:ABC-type transport system involved in multi-copper enzyme maturation permease subunit